MSLTARWVEKMLASGSEAVVPSPNSTSTILPGMTPLTDTTEASSRVPPSDRTASTPAPS
eukprot:CAMPEP_0171675522 /NCGR_PEP_ID=MMETSP0990-20121206/53876_1 /TAXON_ID=483369 /ORGANISM="non described non described, Strain CCMP2098" /LENGTH=59 /DNA_ID=CAMNT_0012261501 /DNA_START=135 /DNA_END=314 /DNA_ORIENTATION=-